MIDRLMQAKAALIDGGSGSADEPTAALFASPASSLPATAVYPGTLWIDMSFPVQHPCHMRRFWGSVYKGFAERLDVDADQD